MIHRHHRRGSGTDHASSKGTSALLSVVALAQDTVDVHAVAEDVAAGGKTGDVDRLASRRLRSRPGSYLGEMPFADDQPSAGRGRTPASKPAARARPGVAARRVVTVTEAEAGLLVAADRVTVRGEDVVALEVEEVPVAMRLRLDEADLARPRCTSRSSRRMANELLERHRWALSSGRFPTRSMGPRPSFSTAERNARPQWPSAW